MKKHISKIIFKCIMLYMLFRQSKFGHITCKVISVITYPFILLFGIIRKIIHRLNVRHSTKILNKYFGCTGTFVLGLPRSGKTTFAAYVAKLCRNAGYDVYANFNCTLAKPYQFTDLGRYDFGVDDGRPSYWLFDEAGIDANNRNFKNAFAGEQGHAALEHLKLLGHYNCRFIILSQGLDCDIKLRTMCARIWLLTKGAFTSSLTPVRRSIGCDEVQHQLMDMYDISGPFKRMFEKLWFFRRPYYKYFDTHERPALPHISTKYGDPLEHSGDSGNVPAAGGLFALRKDEALNASAMSDQLASLFADLGISASNIGLTK